jgi:hypothetical protein
MAFEPEKECSALSVIIGVYHGESDTTETGDHTIKNPDDGKPISVREYNIQHADADGHRIIWSIGRSADFRVGTFVFPQGTDPKYAARMLRKGAELIEANPKVMNQVENSLGEFREGRAIKAKANGSGWEQMP